MRTHKLTLLMRILYKNMLYAKTRHIFMFISFSLLLAFVLMAFSIKPVLKDYYIDKYEDTYGKTDLIMQVGDQSSSRYFSIRPLEEMGETDFYPTFEISMKLEDTYYKVVLTNDISLAYLSNQTVPLTANEVAITKSMSDKTGYSIGDFLTLSLGNQSEMFVVKSVIDDYGTFQGDTLFLNHASNIKTVLSSLVPSLSNLNDAFFSKLYNKVHFETPLVDEKIDTIKAISAYDTLSFTETVPMTYINQQVNRSVALYHMIFLFIVFALMILIETLISYRFMAYQKDFAIIQLQGYGRLFTFNLIFFEFFFTGLIASITSYGLGYIIINIGVKQLGSSVVFIPKVSDIAIAFLLFTTLLVISLFYKYQTLLKTTLIAHTKPILIKHRLVLNSILLGGSLALYNLPVENPFYIWIKLGVMPVLLFSLLKIGQALYQKIPFKRASLLTLKGMIQHKKATTYMIIGLICSISILLLAETNIYMSHRKKQIESEFKADILVTNIFSNLGTIETEIKALEQVEETTPFMQFTNIKIDINEQVLYQVYDIKPNLINAFFDLGMDEELIEAFEQENQPALLLPMRYQVLYGVKIGDSVSLALTEDVFFKVVGFFEHSVGNIAFSNLNQTDFASAYKPKSLLLLTNDKQSTIDDLKASYDDDFIFIIDFQARADALAIEVNKAMDYASFVSGFIIFALFIAMINQVYMLFSELKHTYSLLKSFGVNHKRLRIHMAVEMFILQLFYLVLALVGILFINPLIQPLLIYFDEYEPIHFTLVDAGTGIWQLILIIIVQTTVYLSFGNGLSIENELKRNNNS